MLACRYAALPNLEAVGLEAHTLFAQAVFQAHLLRRLLERCSALAHRLYNPTGLTCHSHLSVFVAQYSASSRMHVGGYAFGAAGARVDTTLVLTTSPGLAYYTMAR